MRYYEWVLQEDDFSIKKKEVSEESEKILKSIAREIKTRNIKIDQMSIARLAEGNISELTIGNKEKIDTSAKIEITFNSKMTKAYLTTYPDLITDVLPSADMINQEISRQGITHGIIQTALIKIKNTKEAFIDEPISESRDAKNGADAEIIYHFHNPGPAKPKILKDGKADFYNTNVIENVKKGQVIIEKKPATAGVPGVTVKGKAIHALNGKNKKIPSGKNLEITSDGLKAIAIIDGMLSTARNRISILPIFEVSGDVDFSTGNIEFLGNVIVKGNLKNGFTIKSGGDVQIHGIVEGGSIEADGNIFIKTGVRGLKKTRIISKGTVSTKFIENAFVSANLDVFVDEAIMHSDIVAGNSVVLSKNKGLIVGGIIRAALFIRCKNIGSSLATKTEFEIGEDPALKDEFLLVSDAYNTVKDNIKKSCQGIKILKETKARQGELSPLKEKMYQDLQHNYKISSEKEEELRLEVLEFSEKLSQLKDAFIDVEEILNPGTEVRIGEYSRKFTNQNYKIRISLSSGEIVTSPLI